MKTILLGGVSAAALLIAGLAGPASAADAAEAAAGAGAASGAGTTIGELVVVAEKRAEKLQTTPVSVSAYSAEQRDLLGIASVQDLTDYTPGLSYSTFDNRPYMRGVGRQTDNLAIESGVAVYVDGVYNGANASTILQSDSLFVDSIEVLRGPQSTLYGRNADGGAINYVSKRPTKALDGEARTGVDSYGKWFVEGAVSGPLTDSLRARLAGNYTQQDGGYYRNIDGSREGGSVAQGGNGKSYHVEVQFDGNLGDKLDYWVKAGTSGYNVSYHTETQLGPLDTREFSNVLFPNQNYGLCGLPGGSAGLGCASAIDQIVPGSVVTMPNTTPANPSDTAIRNFDSDLKSNVDFRKNAVVATSLTYHFPSFDVKYLFGYQQFYYTLIAPWVNNQGVSSGVESYALQGPAKASGFCQYLFSTNPSGCTGNLTIQPAHTNFTFDEFENFYSHEIDFTSTNSGPVQWLAGVYYYHEYYDQPINVNDPSQPQVFTPLSIATFGPAAANPTGSVYNEDTRLHEDSVAGFAQVDWQIAPTLKLTGGARYSSDKKWGFESFRVILFNASQYGLGVGTFGANTPAFDATSCPAVVYAGTSACHINGAGEGVRPLDAVWNAWTGTANLSWTPTPDDLAYAKYSRGFKTGGFNSGTLAPAPETAAETVDAIEVGYKKTIGHTLQANAAAFYYWYANNQQPLGVQNATTGVITTQIINIPEVRSYGFEFESLWQPVRNLTLGVNYAYLSSTIATMNGACYQDIADPAGTAAGARLCPGTTGGLQNLTGATIAESPQNKISLNALYRVQLQTGTLSLSGTFIWKDKEYSSPFNRFYNEAPAYSQVNLRVTWTDLKKRFTVIAYCDNLFDTVGYDAASGTLVATTPVEVTDRLASLTAPRTFGMEVQYHFR